MEAEKSYREVVLHTYGEQFLEAVIPIMDVLESARNSQRTTEHGTRFDIGKLERALKDLSFFHPNFQSMMYPYVKEYKEYVVAVSSSGIDLEFLKDRVAE